MSLSVAFTQPTFRRILPLCVGALLARGRRTVTAAPWTMRGAIRGHSSTYHRVFSRAVWSVWPLGKVLADAVLRWTDPHEPVWVAIDDTAARHKGKYVYGKGRHHDAVRSSHSHVVWRWGHKWVVPAISVTFPFTARRWALPLLAALYRPEELHRSQGRRQSSSARGPTQGPPRPTTPQGPQSFPSSTKWSRAGGGFKPRVPGMAARPAASNWWSARDNGSRPAMA